MVLTRENLRHKFRSRKWKCGGNEKYERLLAEYTGFFSLNMSSKHE